MHIKFLVIAIASGQFVPEDSSYPTAITYFVVLHIPLVAIIPGKGTKSLTMAPLVFDPIPARRILQTVGEKPDIWIIRCADDKTPVQNSIARFAGGFR